MVGVPQRIQAVRYAQTRGLGQRRACQLLGVARAMLTYRHRMPVKDGPLADAIGRVVVQHPAWGIRLIHAWLHGRGNDASFTRMRRIYRSAGHAAQWRRRCRKIRRGPRLTPKACQAHDVWCMDFSEDRLANGARFHSLLVKDEATAFGLDIRVARSFKGSDVEHILDDLIARYGLPTFIRTDNGGQFISYAVSDWARKHGVTLAYIDPGKPWQNGSAESFVGTYRKEVLNAEIFHSLREASTISKAWLTSYNYDRPHSKHDYRPPATAFYPTSAA